MHTINSIVPIALFSILYSIISSFDSIPFYLFGCTKLLFCFFIFPTKSHGNYFWKRREKMYTFYYNNNQYISNISRIGMRMLHIILNVTYYFINTVKYLNNDALNEFHLLEWSFSLGFPCLYLPKWKNEKKKKQTNKSCRWREKPSLIWQHCAEQFV